MMSSLKSVLAKAGSSVVTVCGVIVLGAAMFAAVVYRWATKTTRDVPEAEFTSESVSTER